MTAGQPESVLIVDDDESVLESLARTLVGEGFCVTKARRAADALAAFRHAAPDIVLLDLRMPDRSGWDVFEEMSRVAPLVPIVILTARPNQDETARAAGVGALIEKPAKIPDLVAAMRSLVAESRTARLARLAHGRPETRILQADEERESRRHPD